MLSPGKPDHGRSGRCHTKWWSDPRFRAAEIGQHKILETYGVRLPPGRHLSAAATYQERCLAVRVTELNHGRIRFEGPGNPWTDEDSVFLEQLIDVAGHLDLTAREDQQVIAGSFEFCHDVGGQDNREPVLGNDFHKTLQ